MPTASEPTVGENVSWDDYFAIDGEATNERYAYDRGRLEIRPAPTLGEARRTANFRSLATNYMLHAGVPFDGVGRATLFHAGLRVAADPEASFYVGAVSADVVGVEDLDLHSDPSPNLVILVDRFVASIPREPILAALGVAELWRWSFARDAMVVHRLNDAGDAYVDSLNSLVLPGLPVDALAEHVRLGRHLRDDQIAARWTVFLRNEARP